MKKIPIYIIITLFLTGCIHDVRQQNNPISDIINGEPVIPTSANRIFIKPIVDKTGEPGLKDKLRIKIKETINNDGRLAVVAGSGAADLALEVEIRQYYIQNIQYGTMGQPVRKRMKVVAASRLFDMKKNRLILYDNNIQSFKEFSDLEPPIMTESEVLGDIINNLSKRISTKTVTGWYTEHMTKEERGIR